MTARFEFSFYYNRSQKAKNQNIALCKTKQQYTNTIQYRAMTAMQCMKKLTD